MSRWTLALLGALACRAAPIPATAMYPAGTPFRTTDVTLEGTRLRVIDTGRGPAVVFIHGFAASLYSWRHQLPVVVAAGHRVVAFDNRGFGLSDRPARGYDNAAYARLVVTLLDSLGVADAVLVGHSMGGAIAAEVALVAPARVRGLVLLDPAGYGTSTPRADRQPLLVAAGVNLVTRATTGAFLRALYADPGRVSVEDVDQYYAPLASRTGRAGLRRVLAAFDFAGLRGRAGEVNAPTLVLWGQADRLIPFAAAAGLAKDLPRAAFVLIRSAGHHPHEERPDEVNPLLLGFLRSGLPAIPPDLARLDPIWVAESTR